MNVFDFLRDPAERDTLWWRDELTNDVMTRCELCDATASHSAEKLKQGAFTFLHEPWCTPAMRMNPLTTH